MPAATVRQDLNRLRDTYDLNITTSDQPYVRLDCDAIGEAMGMSGLDVYQELIRIGDTYNLNYITPNHPDYVPRKTNDESDEEGDAAGAEGTTAGA